MKAENVQALVQSLRKKKRCRKNLKTHKVFCGKIWPALISSSYGAKGRHLISKQTDSNNNRCSLLRTHWSEKIKACKLRVTPRTAVITVWPAEHTFRGDWPHSSPSTYILPFCYRGKLLLQRCILTSGYTYTSTAVIISQYALEAVYTSTASKVYNQSKPTTLLSPAPIPSRSVIGEIISFMLY